MSIYVLLVAAFCAVASAELDPRCAWGQSYWCSALDVAKSCGAFDHCKTTVWKNQIVKQDAADSCTFCKAIIDDVKRFVEQGKTKEEISHFLSSACGLIPDQGISDKCKHVVEFMIEQILELISHNVESEMICKLVGLCGGMADTVLHSPVQVEPSVGTNVEPICSDCKKFFGDIKDMITTNQTVAEIEQLIDERVCSLLGSMRDQCKTVVHQLVPQILRILSQYYDPNLICNSLGVCNAHKAYYAKNFQLLTRLRQIPVKNSAPDNSATSCGICKAVLSQLQSMDRDRNVQDALKSFLKNNFCSHIGSLKEMCEKTIDDYSTEFFELLATLLEPTSRCRSLGFCDAGNVATYNKIMPMLPLAPAKRASDESVVPQQNITSGPQCMMCKLVMKKFISMIGSKTTKQSLVHALEKVCQLIPSKPVQQQCVNFVDSYGPAIIEFMVQKLNPDLVCKLLRFCGSIVQQQAPEAAGLAVKAAALKPAWRATADDVNNEGCAVCEMMIQYLEAMLTQNATVAEIQALLDRICYHLPQKYVDKCQSLVKEYTDLLIHYISAMASPKEICKRIGVCDGKTNKRAEAGKTAPGVLGQNECIWGSQYWCINRQNAEKCNAVDYCKLFVWNSNGQ